MGSIPHDLQQAVINDNLVFFIGSGFSHGLGFPDWKGLVKKTLNTLTEKGHDYDDFLPLLEKGRMNEIKILEQVEEHKGLVFDVLEETFELDHPKRELIKNQEKFSALWKASSKIITTNYDRVLETAGSLNATDVVTYHTENSIKKLSRKNRFLFKIHGDIGDSAKCILFQSDYQKLYKKETSPILELKKLISDKVIMFVGFSMTDPFIIDLFDYIKELYSGLKGYQHFIIKTNDEDFSDLGVQSIKLDSYDELPAYLNSLADLKSRNIPTTLETSPSKIDKAALLIAEPISSNYDYSIYLKAIKKLKCGLDIFHLSYESLNELDEYNYLFIFPT